MRKIRKLVGFTKVAAGFGAALALAFTTQTAVAHDPESLAGAAPTTTSVFHLTLTPECKAAISALRTAIVNDRQEDRLERAQAQLNPDPVADKTEDAAERAAIKPLFAVVRSACFPASAGTTTTQPSTSSLSAACTSALQTWKADARAIFTLGTRPTAAQLAQLQSLGQAARTACGWPTWTAWQGWPHR